MRDRTSDLLNSLASSKLTIPTIYIYIDLVFSFSETVSLWEHLYSAIQIYDFDRLSFVVFALHERIARLASSYRNIIRTRVDFLSVKWEIEYLLFAMVSHQDYYQKSRCTVSNCNFQFVSQFLSNDHDVASECKNSEEEKNKISTKSFVISHCRYRRRVVCSNSVQAWMMFSSFSQLLRFYFQLQLNDICLQASLFRNSNI